MFVAGQLGSPRAVRVHPEAVAGANVVCPAELLVRGLPPARLCGPRDGGRRSCSRVCPVPRSLASERTPTTSAARIVCSTLICRATLALGSASSTWKVSPELAAGESCEPRGPAGLDVRRMLQSCSRRRLRAALAVVGTPPVCLVSCRGRCRHPPNDRNEPDLSRHHRRSKSTARHVGSHRHDVDRFVHRHRRSSKRRSS